jgi:hypothetical protein
MVFGAQSEILEQLVSHVGGGRAITVTRNELFNCILTLTTSGYTSSTNSLRLEDLLSQIRHPTQK